jgi:hypothetical protein
MSITSLPVRPGSRRLLALAPLVLLAACTTGGGGSTAEPSASPSPDATASPQVGDIEHPTGADDIILRLEEGGGFVPPSFIATEAPIVTLYGDGTLIVRTEGDFAPPGEDGVLRERPFRIAHLTEEEIQRVLDVAINEGGLGVADASYRYDLVADAPTTTFTLNAGGLDKTVDVYALGIEGPDVEDAEIRDAFLRLSEKLRAIEADGGPTFEDWAPDRYRGIVIDDGGQPAGEPIEWPWPELAPGDFTASGENAFFRSAVLTPEQVEALGLGELRGGAQGIVLTDPEGQLVSFALRPLFPDEES